MKTNLLLIYAYLVCFVTLICGAVYVGIIVHDAVQINAPEFMLPEEVKHEHSDNRRFVESRYEYNTEGKKINTYAGRSEEEITRLREDSYQIEINRERNEAIKSIIEALIILAISMLLFFIHWRLTLKHRG